MSSPDLESSADADKPVKDDHRFQVEIPLTNYMLDEELVGGENKEVGSDQRHPYSLPPLRLRTPRGGEIEIDSVFQRNLRIAKLCNLLDLPEVLTDWRLPKARVPARPDFSRTRPPMFRHIAKNDKDLSNDDSLPVPSKYHAMNLQKLPDYLDLQYDNVPAYVAAYLDSAPRDPLAAEESSRKASARVNEAAPRKTYFPIVNQAEMHTKLVETTDIRQRPPQYQNWCFGCRLELGIQTLDTHPSYDMYICQNRHCPYASWQGLPAIFGPFRDRPVRVGGGYAYMTNREIPDHMTPRGAAQTTSSSNGRLVSTTGSEQTQRNQSYMRRRPHKVIYRPDDLPDIYRSEGFVPFQPKKMKKGLKIKEKLPLPRISETDGVDVAALLRGDGNEKEFFQMSADLSENGFKMDVIITNNQQSADGKLAARLLDQNTGSTEVGDEIGDDGTNNDQMTGDNYSKDLEDVTDELVRNGAMNTHGSFTAEPASHQRSSTSASPPLPGDQVHNRGSSVATPRFSQGMDSGVATADQVESSAGDVEHIQISLLEHSDIPGAHTSLLQTANEKQHGISSTIDDFNGSTNDEGETDSLLNNSNTGSQSDVNAASKGSTDNLTKNLQQAVFVSSYRKPPPTPNIDSSGIDTSRPESLVSNGEKVYQQSTELDKTKDEAKEFSPETEPVTNSPLLSEKPEMHWVVKPLEVKDSVDLFTDYASQLGPPERTCNFAGVYEDSDWLEMEANEVTVTTISSKEFVPIWKISREILEGVMEDVMKRIAKKKPPQKKVKVDIIKKPVGKVEEAEVTDTNTQDPTPPPPEDSTPPPPPGEPTPPPREPTPPPREPTPPPRDPTSPPREPTPVVVPKTPTPPPLPKPPVELPPLPQLPQFTPAVAHPKPTKPKTLTYGASLVSIDSRAKRVVKRKGSPSLTLTPSPKPTLSPDFDFYIVPRSPTPEAKLSTKPILTRKLSSKVEMELPKEEGNDWTFRHRLNVPTVAPPPKPREPELDMLPKIEEKVKTPTPPPPEPAPIRRRLRRNPSTRAIARVIKTFRKKSSRPAAKKELKAVVDPLDYLAKYCLIHPERLPLYERVFKEVVSRQAPRFTDVYCSLDESQPPRVTQVNIPSGAHANLTQEQRQRIRNMSNINGVSNADDVAAANFGEFQVSKLNFTLDQLYSKYDNLLDEYESMETTRNKRMAALAREMFPAILNPDYVVDKKSKKNKKSGKKSKSGKKKSETTMSKEVRATFVLTDAQVIERLSSSEKDTIEADEEVYRLKLKMNRLETKIYSSEDRMDELEAEKAEMQVWSQELYLAENVKSNQKPEFRRAQSALFNKFNPDVDEQMNIEEVEEALRAVNGHLLTDKEMQFIYHILKIPGRKVINLKTFGCIAALSEKVKQLHPDIRKLINKFSFEALEVKMEKCKELYNLLYEGEADKPNGTVPMGSLNVELLAGGLSDENLDFVTKKFNRTEKGYLEYMDFLTYVPLFVELHDRICSNPLTTERVS